MDRRQNRVIDEATFRAARGFAPRSIPDFLALTGDTADGIPGLAGFGEKSAAILLGAYEHLEHIPEHAHQWKVKPRGALQLAATLAAHRAEALLYRKLATLVQDVSARRITGRSPFPRRAACAVRDLVRHRWGDDTQERPETLGASVIRARTLRILLVLFSLLATGYAGVIFWFRSNEDAILFRPERGDLAAAPARLDLESRDVALQSLDSVPLVARLIPPPKGVPVEPAAWILYFHGSSGNIATLGYNEAWARFRRLGLGVLAVDYRGYGKSGGKPSEAGFYRDADAAYAYLTDALHVPPSRILIYGYSLGSAVAIDLASRVPAAGLMVEGAFLSIPARGAELYPFLPVASLARNRFASVDKIAHVRMPKLFIHARGDTDIPIAHGRRLFELAQPPKYFQDVAGGHKNAYEVDPGFFRAVARFVAGLGLPLIGTPAE